MQKFCCELRSAVFFFVHEERQGSNTLQNLDWQHALISVVVYTYIYSNTLRHGVHTDTLVEVWHSVTKLCSFRKSARKSDRFNTMIFGVQTLHFRHPISVWNSWRTKYSTAWDTPFTKSSTNSCHSCLKKTNWNTQKNIKRTLKNTTCQPQMLPSISCTDHVSGLGHSRGETGERRDSLRAWGA